MANVIFDKFWNELGQKLIDMDTDTFKVALMQSTFTPGQTAHNVWTDVSGSEITATSGYTAGGAEITGKTWTEGATTVWDGADVTWASSTITARWAVIYDDTHASDCLVAAIDFAAEKSSSNSNFTIQWNASGILDCSQS